MPPKHWCLEASEEAGQQEELRHKKAAQLAEDSAENHTKQQYCREFR